MLCQACHKVVQKRQSRKIRIDGIRNTAPTKPRRSRENKKYHYRKERSIIGEWRAEPEPETTLPSHECESIKVTLDDIRMYSRSASPQSLPWEEGRTTKTKENKFIERNEERGEWGS